MATRRALRNALASRYLICHTHNALQSEGFSQCIGHSADIAVGMQRFFQKHAPCFLHRRELVQVTHSQLHPLVFYGDYIRERLQNVNMKIARHYPRNPQLLVRRLLTFVRLEGLKIRLQELPYECISYRELLEICMDNTSRQEASSIAKLLDKSGQILIVGHRVYLHPEQVARAMERAMGVCMGGKDEGGREELEKMDREKAEIDLKAERVVRRELWSGLGIMSLQTAGLMRLTFWELSWDVMEPICFYMTSIYFLAGYAFFLTTSTDPTFQALFNARFNTTQKRLMRIIISTSTDSDAFN
eukprot:Gb_35767 [translate_table: standard]